MRKSNPNPRTIPTNSVAFHHGSRCALSHSNPSKEAHRSSPVEKAELDASLYSLYLDPEASPPKETHHELPDLTCKIDYQEVFIPREEPIDGLDPSAKHASRTRLFSQSLLVDDLVNIATRMNVKDVMTRDESDLPNQNDTNSYQDEASAYSLATLFEEENKNNSADQSDLILTFKIELENLNDLIEEMHLFGDKESENLRGLGSVIFAQADATAFVIQFESSELDTQIREAGLEELSEIIHQCMALIGVLNAFYLRLKAKEEVFRAMEPDLIIWAEEKKASNDELNGVDVETLECIFGLPEMFEEIKEGISLFFEGQVEYMEAVIAAEIRVEELEEGEFARDERA